MGTICGHLENYCQELTGSLDTDSAGLIITVPEIKEMINVHILIYHFFHHNNRRFYYLSDKGTYRTIDAFQNY